MASSSEKVEADGGGASGRTGRNILNPSTRRFVILKIPKRLDNAEMEMLYANLAVLAINIGVLAMTLKLYTEILKDASQNRRASR